MSDTKTGAFDSESGNTCFVVLTGSEHFPKSLWKTRSTGLRACDVTPEIIARFHEKYNSDGDGCWLWKSACYQGGYGMLALGRSTGKFRVGYAHRIAYVLAHGDIPAGRVVMHSCDVPACVNPSHLSLGTQGENVNDAARKGHYNRPRFAARKISDSQLAEIRASVETTTALAARYGVTRSTISVLRRGLRRKAA